MPDPERMSGDEFYPTEEQLDLIKRADPWTAIEALREAWIKPYGSASEDLRPEERKFVDRNDGGRRFLRLATGGWSGNEELWAAYKQNFVAMTLTWVLSARGGLHILQFPPSTLKESR